jgi:K+-transporting ATPase ATPase C chain
LKKDMKKNLVTSLLMTVVTTVLLGLIYPLLVTGLAQLLFRDKANGQLISKNGELVGSRIIGQSFTGPGYFHSRPSAAGSGYDASNSNGSQLGPTNQHLIDRVTADVAAEVAANEGAGTKAVPPVPIDLVTTSASGLDPDISPAAADFQVGRIARERKLVEAEVRRLVQENTSHLQWAFLGEERVNVLELNLALDVMSGRK